MRDLPLAELPDLILAGGFVGMQRNPGAKFLAQIGTGHTEDLHFPHFRMAVEELLDLTRIDVLAAADHHVLHATDDVAVTLFIEDRQIARVHPAAGIHGIAGAFRLVPVGSEEHTSELQSLMRISYAVF